MINPILDVVTKKVKTLGFIEAQYYFSISNIPDPLADKSFLIAPLPIDPGDKEASNSRATMGGKMIVLKAGFKISLFRKITANKSSEVKKAMNSNIESIIQSLLSAEADNSQIDDITFLGSSYNAEPTTNLVNESNFSINYRLENFN